MFGLWYRVGNPLLPLTSMVVLAVLAPLACAVAVWWVNSPSRRLARARRGFLAAYQRYGQRYRVWRMFEQAERAELLCEDLRIMRVSRFYQDTRSGGRKADAVLYRGGVPQDLPGRVWVAELIAPGGRRSYFRSRLQDVWFSPGSGPSGLRDGQWLLVGGVMSWDGWRHHNDTSVYFVSDVLLRMPADAWQVASSFRTGREPGMPLPAQFGLSADLSRLLDSTDSHSEGAAHG